MRLGAQLMIDGDVVLIEEMAADGSVVAAGGMAGDRWLTIDGAPAAAVVDEWQSGARPRRAGIPFLVEGVRDGRAITLRPMWRSDLDAAAPEQVIPSDQAADARDEAGADTTAEAAAPTRQASAPRLRVHNVSPSVAPSDRLRAQLGRPPLPPELADALRRERESTPRQPYNPYADVDWWTR
jgi:hypothetical protein